ncbi:hypothetical protein T11_14341, partial [Trichinella zimbabwensis]
LQRKEPKTSVYLKNLLLPILSSVSLLHLPLLKFIRNILKF